MPQKDRFSIKFKEKLERELSADESVLWMDEPAPIFAKNLFLIIVSVAFLFSLFAIDSFNAWTASLFAIIIVAVIISLKRCLRYELYSEHQKYHYPNRH
jgi:predicted tellurium resistance membrane protein TerC